jgi:hypothetical protein
MKTGKFGGSPSILKLDIDTRYFNKFLKDFVKRYRRVKYSINIKIKETKVYQTNRGYHIEFILNKKILPYEVIFYQLLFLSDTNREVFNLRRLRFRRTTINEWNILHDGKYDSKTKKFIFRKRTASLETRLMHIINMEEIENDE